MFTGPLEHRIAIRELHETYGAGVLAKDPVLWGSVWAEDARWSLLGHEVAGRAAIVAFWSAAMDACDAVSFVSCQPASSSMATPAVGLPRRTRYCGRAMAQRGC
jgi:hypothetical protein